MGTQLHQALRTFCYNTDWKYAVFWKLTHRARMMLTWEDAYYENRKQHNSSGSKCISETVGNFWDGHYSHDSLELAVANMSYHVYSLGEGIVGQVAVTGKHRWIFADKHVTDAYSSLEHYAGWQTQFSAGIRTIVVVAVVPHGVIQLGSLYEITEDLQLVNHIRDIFSVFQDSSVGRIPSVIQCTTKKSLCTADISTRSDSEVFNDCLSNLDRIVNTERTKNWSSLCPPLGKLSDCSYIVPLPGGYPKKSLEMTNKHGRVDFSTLGRCEIHDILLSKSENLLVEQQKQVERNLLINSTYDGSTSSSREQGVGSEDCDILSSLTVLNNRNKLYNITFPADYSGLDSMYFPSTLPDSTASNLPDSTALNNEKGVFCELDTFDLQSWKDLENNLEFQKEFGQMDVLNTHYEFSAGCELYEALRPAFGKQNICSDQETEKTETDMVIDMPVGIGSTSLLREDSEHLLQAVVANTCHSGTDVKSEKSCRSVQSLLTTEKMPELTRGKHSVGSGGYSFDQSLVEVVPFQCLNSSEACDVTTSLSACNEPLERRQEPAKINKKRARPGEKCRPRPRDRQLIQDRIKELRELVSNGSKCSIDLLLDRTIKHMVFLQSITKHADKLSKSSKSKLRTKETGTRVFPSYAKGSSWAVEVGNQLKVCPIMIENMNMNGQMVIEMLCEECCQFLKIAEAIRSLGLTILKGVTEAYGEKTWICFIVEGQENRSMHRMDTLWSLLQILHPNATV